MDSLRILAVEDNPADFRLLTEYLGEDPSSHFEVVHAGTLKEALVRLLGEEFAAVLLDLNLPDAHGLEVLEKVIAVKRSPPVIVLTGADNPEIGLRALSKKAQDYLVKGQIDNSSLIRSIRYAIERSKAEQSARQMNAELEKRSADIQRANEALQASRAAALNLMEDALAARHKAEQVSAELATVSERLAFSQQSAGAGTWDWDMISGKLDWSPELFRLLGLDPATTQASFDVWQSVILPEDRQIASDRIEQAIQNHARLVNEYRVKFSTGEVRWINVLGDTTYEVTGKPLRMSGICLDITERKRAQIREQEALAVAAAAQTAIDTLEAMGEGVLLTDMEGRIQSVNSALEKMSGYLETEIKGRNLEQILTELIAEEDRAKALRAIAVARKGKKPGLEPVTLISKKGHRVPVMPATSFLRGPDGTHTGLVLTLRDISELRATYHALEESEQKYRELVESANSIILRITPDQNILFFNEYAETFFGYDESELLGKNVIGTIVPPVDSTGRDMTALMRAISENTAAYASNENENMCKDGRRVWVHWTNRAVRDAEGKIREILCVGVDVTQRKRLEMERERYQQRLRELAERLASTEERERRRISTQIHDTVIQTLSLSNIKLGSVRKELTDADLAERADEVNNARSLIEDAIKESRSLMAELTPPLLYELGFAPALQDLTQRLEKQHRIPICVHDDGQPKPLDKPIQGSLFEVTRELIVNALKHAGQCAITIDLAREDDHLRICVADNGAGFKVPEDGRFVFHQGGGFGLFSIHERLHQIGGSLDVHSEPGKGTTAIILVPLNSRA